MGVMIFVLSKLVAKARDSSRDNFPSKRGMSSWDSCLMCSCKSSIRRSRRGAKEGEEGDKDWSL